MTVVMGDVTQDDILNVIDIVMLINFIINENTISDKQFAISDINQDGSVDVLDVVLIVGIILAY